MHNVDIRNVSLGQMLYFVKVAEYKNITKAAQFFNIGQPTLSKKLKSLEMQLDLQLFIRTKNTISLTPAGRYLFEEWSRRVQGLEEEIQYAHVLQTGHSKSIVAACLDSFRPDVFFLPLVDEFMEDNPDIHIRIESDAAQDIRRMLFNKEADVIFSICYDFEEKEAVEVAWRKLGKTPHCACMKKTNPLAQKESLSICDLKQADFVCISPQYLPEYSRMIHAMCATRGFAPNISKYVSSANSLTLNIRSDRDVFICDKYYSDLNCDDHVLIPIRDSESGFVMAWHKNSGKPYLEDFVETVLWKYE
ncbi:MAG: LysR family transcriptional regulator [Eubacterium sp.]|nr:LysR family transcriptional regulator [Eubacterium sp.]